MGRVTLQTIADYVGVSRATVSNAFSRPDQLSSGLRARILEVAAEHGYAGPHPVARGLRSGRVGAIGVLLTETIRYALTDSYTALFLSGLADEAAGSGTGLLLVPLPPGQQSAATVRNAVVDGFVALAMPDGHPALEAAVGRRVPLVTVDGPELPGYGFVGIDDRAAAETMTDHVLAHGHRRLAVLTFRVQDDDVSGVVDDARLAGSTYSGTRRRLRGVLDATERHGIAREAVTIEEVGPNDDRLVARALNALFEGERPPTAIIAVSDRIALTALEVLRARGIQVPEEVSVTGFDDLPDARAHGLTTIRQPCAVKGAHAARLLQQPSEGDRIILPHELITRSTLAPPPA